MSLFTEPETYSVAALCAEVRDLLRQAYPSVWVAGEVNRLRASQRGHLYFELVEKGERDEIVGKLEAVAWRRDHQRLRGVLARAGQELAEGQAIRCRGEVDFYPPFGRLQLVVREVDPVFTLGLLARRRRETLEALSAAGLLERNKRLALAEVPLRIALITSEGSAAYHDFLSGLRASGYGFRVLFLHASVQGRDAEGEIGSALAALAGLPIDCAVLIRGGGSRTDLAVFDSRSVAEAVARAPVPVLTGVGHEIDESIADLAAHTALKTPTQAAEFLVLRVGGAELRLEETRAAVGRAGLAALRGGREALGRVEQGMRFAGFRLASASGRLRQLAGGLRRGGARRLRHEGGAVGRLIGRLGDASRRRLARRRGAPDAMARGLAVRARDRLRESTATLDGWERLVSRLGPERTLARGFSITRDGGGRLLRDPGRLAAGDRLTTELAAGVVRSRVETT